MEIYREKLASYGIKHAPATMILLAMVEYGLNYSEALQEVADFKQCAPELMHSGLCYWMLVAGIETPAPIWFNKLVDEIINGDDFDDED